MSWPNVALAEVCEINVGRTPARKEAKYWVEGVHPWASIADLGRQPRLHETKELISEVAVRECNMRLVPTGTVLFSFKLSIGKVGVAERPLYTNEAIAALIVKDRSKLDEAYLAHSLRAIDFSDVGSHAVMGRTLNKASLKLLEIPLPPLEEQKRIAGILDQADALRRLRTRALDKLNTLGQAIFHEMFGDPVGSASKYSQRPLKEYVQDDRPITYGILKPGPDTPGGVPYIRVVDMVIDEVDVSNVRRTTSKIAGNYVRSRLRAGDLLMSIRGHVGRTAIVPAELEGANITQDTARLSVPAEEAEFFRYSILHPGTQEWMRRRTKGAAVKGINLGDLRELPVPDVPHDERIAFCQKLDSVRSKLTAHRKADAHSQTLFASLQHRAFRGEL